MTPPTEEEWYSVIDALAPNKAPGPSKISNEMIKNLGPLTKKSLWVLICDCVNTSFLPDA